MTAFDPEELDAIRRALVGQRHIERYNRSATFRAKVDVLAELLPTMIDGLAAEADQISHDQQREMLRLMSFPIWQSPNPGPSA